MFTPTYDVFTPFQLTATRKLQSLAPVKGAFIVYAWKCGLGVRGAVGKIQDKTAKKCFDPHPHPLVPCEISGDCYSVSEHYGISKSY